MLRQLRWTALPLLVVASAFSPIAVEAAEVRDHAGMFSAQAVKKAQDELNRVENQSGVPIHLETISSIPGLPAGASDAVRHQAVNDLALKRAREIREGGVYMLISKDDRLFSPLLVSDRYASAFPPSHRKLVRDSFLAALKKGDYDGGLLAAADAIDVALPNSPVPVAREGQRNRPGVAVDRRAFPPAQRRPEAQFGFGSLFTIVLGILGVMFVVRLLSGAFGGGGAGYPQGMPGRGMGGPGYGGGYGGGGGFFSSLLGGIGGAMAGNWMYDQFSGRNSSHHDPSTGYNSMSGQDDYGGSAGGDTWSSPDAGGGDWGGGDWGGGGGDWGGGDGGGDW